MITFKHDITKLSSKDLARYEDFLLDKLSGAWMPGNDRLKIIERLEDIVKERHMRDGRVENASS